MHTMQARTITRHEKGPVSNTRHITGIHVLPISCQVQQKGTAATVTILRTMCTPNTAHIHDSVTAAIMICKISLCKIGQNLTATGPLPLACLCTGLLHTLTEQRAVCSKAQYGFPAQVLPEPTLSKVAYIEDWQNIPPLNATVGHLPLDHRSTFSQAIKWPVNVWPPTCTWSSGWQQLSRAPTAAAYPHQHKMPWLRSLRVLQLLARHQAQSTRQQVMTVYAGP